MREWILSACTARSGSCGTLILRQLWVSMGTFWETISTRQWARSNLRSLAQAASIRRSGLKPVISTNSRLSSKWPLIASGLPPILPQLPISQFLDNFRFAERFGS